MVGLMVTSYKRAYLISRSTVSRPPVTEVGHCWPVLLQETLKHTFFLVSMGFLGPGEHKVLFEPSEHLRQVCGLILNLTLPLLPSCLVFSFSLGHGVCVCIYIVCWDTTFSCWWLLSSDLQFWNSPRRWVHVLLLCHIVFQGTNKTLCKPDPGERSSDPIRDWPRLASEYPGVTGRGVCWHWPATWLEALSAVVHAWDISRRSPLSSIPPP